MVNAQAALIQDLQTDECWRDVTLPMLERVRRRLRDLIRLIEKRRRKPVYTDFVDVMGVERDVTLPGLGDTGSSFAKFRQKAQVYLRDHQNIGSHVQPWQLLCVVEIRCTAHSNAQVDTWISRLHASRLSATGHFLLRDSGSLGARMSDRTSHLRRQTQQSHPPI